jgi:hypothetical protein
MADHFYTTNQIESYGAANGGYKFEELQCNVFLENPPGTHIFHRLYNGSNHFYTVDDVEAENAVGNDGYVIEKMPCFVFPVKSPGAIPLFRAYNHNTNDHFYTTDQSEFNNSIAHGGYSPEGADGVCCYVLPVTCDQTHRTGPLFRLFQP